MLSKLFKYEWKMGSRLFLAIHGCMLIFAILSRLFLEVSGGLEQAMSSNGAVSIISALLITAMVFIVISVAMFTYIYIGYRFYKNVFTDQGYLTNTLPVTPVQLIVSKGLVAVLYMVIDFFALLLGLCILFCDKNFFPDFFSILGEIISSLDHLPAAFWVTLIAMILSPFMMIIHLYFCVAVGNLFNGHKVLGAVAAYIGSYTIMQILQIIILFFTGYKFLGTYVDSDGFFSSMNYTIIASVLLSVAFGICFWFATKFIMERRLNLQ